MIEIPVHNQQGEPVGAWQVDEAQLGGEVRPKLLKQAYVRYHANRRQGTASTRNRGLVEGSTRKLYRQKGTGNARRGALRTNIMKGGGVAFAKKPKSWRQGMPRKMRRLADRNALLAKAVDQEVKLVDRLEFDKPSTRQFSRLLSALDVQQSCLVALRDTTGFEARSAANLPNVTLRRVDQINVFDLLTHRYLLVERDQLASWVEKSVAGADGVDELPAESGAVEEALTAPGQQVEAEAEAEAAAQGGEER